MARTLNVTGVAALAVCLAAVALPAAAGDAAKGADVFKKMCSTCHTIEKGGGNGPLGPNLFGAAGRNAAGVANFGYSAALKNAGIVWSDDKLRAWVQNPQKMVPGAKMILIHAPSAEQADDVVAFLETKK
jgi:cytochrome c